MACASADESFVAIEDRVSGPPPPAGKLARQSRASVEQKLRIKSFTSEDLHLCLFDDIAHKTASIPQSGSLLFSRASGGAYPQSLISAHRSPPAETPTAPRI